MKFLLSWEIAKNVNDIHVTEVDHKNFLAKFKYDKYESELVSAPLCALSYNHEQMPWDKFAHTPDANTSLLAWPLFPPPPPKPIQC